MTGLPFVPAGIDDVATLIVVYADPVLQSGGWTGAVRPHCRVAVQQKHLCSAAFSASEIACSMVNCWGEDIFSRA